MVADIPDKDGRTPRQKNLELKHKIPIGTLVETTSEHNYGWEGCRLFVCEHTRDCDNTPLYSLAMSADEFELSGLTYDGFGEDNLIVVEGKEEKV